MIPLMLITGASRGVGRACADYFASHYRVATVARTGDVTDRGDLTDSKFLAELINKYPVVDVFINNAGGSRPRFRSVSALNFVAAGVLLEHYATVMSGHIINLSSNAAYGAEAYSCGYQKMPMHRIGYCAVKQGIKFYSNALARACPNVKITSLEPGRITNYADIPPIILWILQQPFQVNTLHFTPKP